MQVVIKKELGLAAAAAASDRGWPEDFQHNFKKAFDEAESTLLHNRYMKPHNIYSGARESRTRGGALRINRRVVVSSSAAKRVSLGCVLTPAAVCCTGKGAAPQARVGAAVQSRQGSHCSRREAGSARASALHRPAPPGPLALTRLFRSAVSMLTETVLGFVRRA